MSETTGTKSVFTSKLNWLGAIMMVCGLLQDPAAVKLLGELIPPPIPVQDPIGGRAIGDGYPYLLHFPIYQPYWWRKEVGLMEWLKIFEIPALMISGLCIVVLGSIVHMLGKMLISRDELQAKLAVEMSEGNKLASRMAALLDLLCSKWLSGGGPRT